MLGGSSCRPWVTTMSRAPLLNYTELVCEGEGSGCCLLLQQAYPIQTGI